MDVVIKYLSNSIGNMIHYHSPCHWQVFGPWGLLESLCRSILFLVGRGLESAGGGRSANLKIGRPYALMKNWLARFISRYLTAYCMSLPACNLLILCYVGSCTCEGFFKQIIGYRNQTAYHREKFSLQQVTRNRCQIENCCRGGVIIKD